MDAVSVVGLMGHFFPILTHPPSIVNNARQYEKEKKGKKGNMKASRYNFTTFLASCGNS